MRFMAAIDGRIQGEQYTQGEEIPEEIVEDWSSRVIQRLLSRGLIAPFVAPPSDGPGIPLGGLPGQYLGIDEDGDLAYFNLVAPEVYRRVWDADTQYHAGELVNSGSDLWAARVDNVNTLPTAVRTYTPVGSNNVGANTQAAYAEIYHPMKVNADTLIGAVDIGCLGDPGPIEFWLTRTDGDVNGVWEPMPVTAKKTMQPANVGANNNTQLRRLIFDDPYFLAAGDQLALVVSSPGSTQFNTQIGFTAGGGTYSGRLVMPTLMSYGDGDFTRAHNGSWAVKEAFRRMCVQLVATTDVAWDRIASRV